MAVLCARTGGRLRAEGGDCDACVRAADAEGGLRPKRRDLRPEHPDDRHGNGGAQQLRRRLHPRRADY